MRKAKQASLWILQKTDRMIKVPLIRYYNVKWWLYWKRISDLSSCLGVISTKLLSLITSNTYYQCQGIFFVLCQFQVRLWGNYCAYVWLTMRLGKTFHGLLLITVNEWREPRELSIYSLILLFIFSFFLISSPLYNWWCFEQTIHVFPFSMPRDLHRTLSGYLWKDA